MGDPGNVLSFPSRQNTKAAMGAEFRKDCCGASSLMPFDDGQRAALGYGFTELDTARAELRRQNEWVQLLLNLMRQVNSSPDLYAILRSISASVREALHGEYASIAVHDTASGQMKLCVLDFPQSKGSLREGSLFPVIGAGTRALETLQPVIAGIGELCEFGPEEYAELAAPGGAGNVCLVPLVNRDRAFGLLTIVKMTKSSFAPEEIEFLGQIAGLIAIAIGNSRSSDEISNVKDQPGQEKLYLQEEGRSELGFEQIIGKSPALMQVLQLVQTVAPTDSTVLLLGETGTGKELLARAIHDRSRRKASTFVKLNCAAIPTGLLESELFGHEKGAFTGAISQKLGRMELADQGTLFLDEVGDIPLEVQPKLLRVLQEREFERLGSTHTRKVNVRLIAATNRDLEEMVAERQFRADLFYRLNVFPIRIPPLRERREDIPLLIHYFVQKIAKQMQKRIDSIPASVVSALAAFEWPGNIRELENFMERAVILTGGKVLNPPLHELRKVKREMQPISSAGAGSGNVSQIVRDTVAELNGDRIRDEYAQRQREEILRALSESKGRVSGDHGAAARLAIKRTTFVSRMRKFGIDPRQYS